MKNKSARTLFRDICILAGLIVLMSYAYKKAYSFLVLHKKSIIHELDKSFADQLYDTQRQVRTIKSILEKQHVNNSTLIQAEDALKKIDEKYKKNSPGLLFLGPIGTTSIVLKEQELKKKLLIVVNSLGSLLSALVDSKKIYGSAQSVESGLQTNKNFITILLKRYS